MSRSFCDTTVLPRPSPTSQTAGSLCFLPNEQLRTSYAPLRPGAPQLFADRTAQLPIRVVPTEEGVYEVIDGFKRLSGWREQGHSHIPVVLEPPGSTVEHKRLLLLANSPARTLTALDEARVVCSLMNEDLLSAKAIARRLGRKLKWVACRVDIGTRLSPMAENKLARGAFGPTLAHALCALPAKDQDALLGAMQRHGLKARETLTLLYAYRVADGPDRREVLRSALGVVRAKPSPDPVSSPTAIALERRLEQIQEALVSLAGFVIPSELAPGEQRRLEARLKSVLAQLENTACAHRSEQGVPNLQGENNEREQRSTQQLALPTSQTEARPSKDRPWPRDSERNPTATCLLRNQRNCSPGGLLAQDRSAFLERARLSCPARANLQGEQARSFPHDDRAEGRQRAYGEPHSARDPRAGLLGRKEHSRRVCQKPTGETGPQATQNRQTPLRDPPG